MSPNAQLTPNAIQKIERLGVNEIKPTLQVLDIKRIQSQAAQGMTERFKLVVSDGTNYQQAMLATQLNPMVTDNAILTHGLIQLHEYICNEVQGKKILIILRMEVVSGSIGHKIGDPVEYRGGGGGASVGASGGTGSGYGGAASAPRAPAAPQLSTMQGAPVPYQAGGQAASSHNAPSSGGYRPGAATPAYNASQGGGGYQSHTSSQVNNNNNNNNSYGGGNNSYGGAHSSYGGSASRQESGAVVRDEHAVPIIPIAELNPYQNKWTIKARVTNRSDIRRWSNAKGEGTLFSIDLLDEHGGEIRATFFKEAVDKFYTMLEAGRVFTFSGGRLKVAQKQWSSIKNNYEITFDERSEINPVDDDKKIQTALYSFKKINTIEQIEPGQTMDVIGVLKAFGPDTTITTKKDGREVAKRELTIVDDSGVEVRITIWGDKAVQNPEQWEGHPIIAFKGVKVSDFNGRSLGTMPSSTMTLNPDLPEASDLYNWWYHEGSTAASTSISSGGGGSGAPATFDSRHYLCQIKDDYLGHGEKADYIDVKATLTYIKSEPDPWYRACTLGDCKRKVTEEMGGYRCEKCQRTMENCAYRYILNCSATDHTGSSYFSCFDEQAVQLLGKTAEEMNTFKATDQTARYEAVFSDANFNPYVFRVRVKVENVNDEQRVKCNIVGVRQISYVQECRDLITTISRYL